MSFFWFAAIFLFGCFFYFTDENIRAEVRNSPIYFVFISCFPALLYLFVKMLNTFSSKLRSDGHELIFSNLSKRISVPLVEVQKITITSPDLIETSLSGPTPKPITFDGRFKIYTGGSHTLHIQKKDAPQPTQLSIGPGWRKEDLERFVKELGKA